MNTNDNAVFDERVINEAAYIAYSKNDFTQLEQLIKAGLDINHKKIHDTLKYTEFKVEPMEKLTALGFDVNRKGGMGGFPKFFDFIRDLEGDVALLKRVLNIKGIDFNATSKRGSNVLSTFDSSLETLTLEQADDYTLVFIKTIIEKGFNYAFINKTGDTTLHYIEKSPKAVAYLVEKGLDINVANAKGKTPLMQFCIEASNNEAYLEAVKKYIALGADIHSTINDEESSRHGWTALHYAILGRVPLIVDYLLSIGAKTDQVFKEGVTTLDLAIKTKNQDIMALFMDNVEAHKTPSVIKSMITFFLANMNYSKIIAWFEALPLEDANWETLHTASIAYRKMGDIESATKYGVLAIEKFGINNFLLDNMVFIYVMNGEFQKALDIWQQYRPDFDPTADPAANTIAHVVVAYDQLGKYKDGFEDVIVFVEKAENTRETRAGLLFFNVACLAANTNAIEDAIILSARAINKDYTSADFSDSSFDTIRDTAIFKTLMSFADDQVLYLTFKKEDSTVTFYSRCRDEYDFITEHGKVRSAETRSFNDLGHMLRMVYSEIDNLKQDGYKAYAVDFLKIWGPVYDTIFKNIGASTQKPLGTLNVEWDFDHNDNTLTRPYYVYSDNGYDLDHYDDVYYIPTQKIFETIIKEVVKLDSFKVLNKKETVQIIQSEHDAGNEFFYSYKVL
ncbi:ankyrin repeat domain-containing protein [Olleya sp. HaHaR_3_96]|uniref:ankyrin repeat domain-containing protein n=1 Tax=Olleya sp. HaHaR_3_96 TaxID=2745560 RepID=UPI001C4EC891|nr:ankyrin repeat domain-containing protein [Olleya sp. HaHaR_3_96]QXP58675.1 ankyrin repeat domain-containing protein [Olleya sp. HaHaR_3_96]